MQRQPARATWLQLSGELAAELTVRCTGMRWVMEGAGGAASGSAARYEGDDTAAAQRYDGLGF